MDIRKDVKAFNIVEKVTDTYRKEHDIPGTESLLEMMQAEELVLPKFGSVRLFSKIFEH